MQCWPAYIALVADTAARAMFSTASCDDKAVDHRIESFHDRHNSPPVVPASLGFLQECQSLHVAQGCQQSATSPEQSCQVLGVLC